MISKLTPKLRIRLCFGAAIFVVTSGVLLYSIYANRMVDLDFRNAAPSKGFDQAFAQIQRGGRGNGTEAVFNGDAVKVVCYLKRGEGNGTSPRFLNIGKTPAVVYKGTSGAFYILGTVRVLTYDGGTAEWVMGDAVTNRKYIYTSK